MDFFELPEAAQILRSGLAREGPWPQCPGDLSHINVAPRVDTHAMRADERRRPEAGMGVAEPREELPLVVDDADARPQIRALEVDCHGRPELADIADRVTGIVHVEAARPVQIVPLRLILAVAVEYLNTVVLAVGDIDPAVGVGADIVHDVELSRAGAGLAPRHQQLAVGRIFMDARVAVTV